MNQKLMLRCMTVLACVTILAVPAIIVAVNVNDTAEQKLLTTNELENTADTGLMTRYVQKYQVDETDGPTNTYIRYHSSTGNIVVVRIQEVNSLTTFGKSITTWANRSNATYTAINE